MREANKSTLSVDSWKRARKEVRNLFNYKKKVVSEKRVAWRHKFVCLAYIHQTKIPSTDAEKEELYQAGLGEKEISFESLDMSQADFRNILLHNFPPLNKGCGFQLLKGVLVVCITVV